MKSLFLFIALFISSVSAYSTEKTFKPGEFTKVVVSPHISVTFVEGDEETVEVVSMTKSIDKFNLELKNKKLHLFLDDAKTSIGKNGVQTAFSKSNKYIGTVAEVIVTYKKLVSADVRGEEKVLIESTLDQSDFRLFIYGESKVVINELALSDFRVTIYGESRLQVKAGNADYQKITAYGESKVDSSNLNSRLVKITAYGDGKYELSVDENLKVVSFGESEIIYTGDPDINKKIVIGETNLKKKSQ